MMCHPSIGETRLNGNSGWVSWPWGWGISDIRVGGVYVTQIFMDVVWTSHAGGGQLAS